MNSGKYIAAAVENFIDSLAMDIQNKRYGFITDDFIDLENTDSTHILLKIELGQKSRTNLRRKATLFSYDAQDYDFASAIDSHSVKKETANYLIYHNLLK